MQTKGMLVTLITLLLAITSFGQSIPIVYTDKLDYQPGEVVIIEGDGWRPGEQVKLEIVHSIITHGTTILYATADINGHIRNDEFIIMPYEWGESFVLTATGMSSGFTAKTEFTDGNAFRATITPTSVSSGATNTYTLRVTNISDANGNSGNPPANLKSFEITIPLVFTAVSNLTINSTNATSAFVFENSGNFSGGYNSTNGAIRCYAPSGDGLRGGVTPNPYFEITFTATSPFPSNQPSYTFEAKASDVNNYIFTGNNKIPIEKLSGDLQPVVTVTACAAPTINTPPGAQIITYGNDALFTVQTTTATYQWQVSTNGGGGWNDISNGGVYSGVTTNTLSLIKPPFSYNGYLYRCVASFCSGTKSTNSNSATLTVNKASLTVTADDKNKTYGDANPAFTVSYSGFVSGEGTSSLTTQPTAASAANTTSGVGNYPIIPSGGVAANYSFTYVNGSLAIGARTITVTADAKSRTYGDADPALSYQITSGELVNGDGFAGALARDAGNNVGTYAINQGTLALTTNYILSYEGADFTITERAITVTAQAKSKVYGDADPALTYTVTVGSLAYSDAFSGGLTRDAGNNVGTYAINQGTLALTANYTLSYEGADFTITERAITVTAQAKSKVYGDADPALTYTVTVGSLAYSDAFTGGLTRDAGNNVGTYAINQGTLALTTNYILSYEGADFTITERAITVTAQAKSKVYGDADPALTYTVTLGSLAYSDAFSGGLTRDAGNNVGTYAINQGTLALTANYTLSYEGADFTITERAITVTAQAKSKTYGDADPALTYTVTLGSLAYSDAFTGGLTRDAGNNVGTYAINQGTLALTTNYILSYEGADFTITERAITVTAQAKSKVYGDADPALTYTVTLGSLAYSDAFTGGLTRDAGNNVGTYAINQGTLALTTNYILSYEGADFTITERAITVTAQAKSKVYGDADPALTYTVTLGSLAYSDAFTGGLTRDAGNNVGTYAINQGTLALTANYTLSYEGADFTITERAITVTAQAKSKVYGDADPGLTYTVTVGSLAYSDAFTGGLTRDAGNNVGTYAINQGTLALTANYTLSYAGADFTITERAITVTAQAKSKVYGNADPALTYTVTVGSLAYSDAFTGGLTRDAGNNVGTYAINQGTLALTANYTLSYEGADFTITERAITVTAQAKSKVYGDADPALTYTVTVGSLAYSDAFTGGLTRDAGNNVGTYAINQGTLALTANYTLSYEGADFTITERAITVTAQAKSKVYGNADPALTYTVTVGSLAYSDAFSGGLTRDAGNNVGTYAINQGTLALTANYTLSYEGADFTITERAITVTAQAKSKVYGDADPALTYTVTLGSLAYSDAFTGGLTRDAGNNVGTYAINQGTLALTANYTLSYEGADFTITERAITVTAQAKSKVYGDADPALTYTVTLGSLAYSDAFTGGLTRDAGNNVGTYAINQGTLALTANYTLSYEGADFTITERAITVTAQAKSKVYGDADPALTYTVTVGSLAYSDAFSGALTRVAGENIGAYAIQQGTLALNTNYTLTYEGANLTINKRPLTITVNSKNKLYGAPIPTLDGIETGIVASDNITVSYSTTATDASPIGYYPITATPNDPDGRLFNYTVTNTPATLTIAVVPVTNYVSTNVATQQYSDVVTFTATINNGAPVVTGANGAAVSVTFKVGNQIMGTVPFTVSGNNLVGVLENKQLVEGLAGQMSPGSKTVTAIYNTPNANYGLNSSNNTGTCSLMITKENADITFTGLNYVSLPTTTAITMTVHLSATIRDLFPSADSDRGNIKNARVTFKKDDGTTLGTPNLTPVLMTDSTTGLVATSFTYTLTTGEQQAGGASLQVYAVVDNYYTIGASDMPTTITIARPGADFVTGGGYLRNSSCAGAIAGTKDLKTNFGFNMQYTKSGSNLKGQCNIIIRSNGRIYQVKSNAVNMLAVSPSNTSGTPAYFNTKANYKDITDPLNPIALGGNMDLTVRMNDVSTGGQGDQVSILLMDPNTTQVLFSSNWNGAQTILQNLGGGNVSVRSTPSNTTITSAREGMTEEIQMPVIVHPFTVKVYGNPAQDHFNVNIKGSEGKISLRVVDIQGRIVESRQNVPEGTLQLGGSYRSGYYYLEVRQGNNIKQIKLVKL